jgi:hypothetical protein
MPTTPAKSKPTRLPLISEVRRWKVTTKTRKPVKKEKTALCPK